MPDKIVNHFVLADGSTAKYSAGALLNLDDTVSLVGYAPDAKAVGDRLTDVENLVETLNEGGLELKDDVIAVNVEDWLDAHPEATTTVQDGAITFEKLNGELKMVVSPVMFGAVGDGNTVDNIALNACFEFCANNGAICDGLRKTYLVDNSTPSYCGHYGAKLSGGATVRNITLKLKVGSVDMETPLACLHSNKDYYFQNCTFIGELRTPTIGAEDGGNHGVIFCNGETMFPPDWATTGKIIFENCTFKNIQSYGIFPTPFNNKLVVNNCDFFCHGPAILSYATMSCVSNSSYTNLSSSGNVIPTFVIDEIENFSEPSNIKKNIYLEHLTSNADILRINHTPQIGVTYGEIAIDNCSAGRFLSFIFAPNGSLLFGDNIRISNSSGGGSDEPGSFTMRTTRVTCDNLTYDNVKTGKNGIVMSGTTAKNVYLSNTTLEQPVLTDSANIDSFYISNVTFSGTTVDGYVTGRYGSTYGTIARLYVTNAIIKTTEKIILNNDINTVFASSVICDNYTQFIGNDVPTSTKVYIDGLVMPNSNAINTYTIQNTLSGGVVAGLAPDVATLNAGNILIDLSKDLTWKTLLSGIDFTPTQTGVYEYTGITVTATKSSIIWVGGVYANSYVEGLAIATRNTSPIYITTAIANDAESGFNVIFPIEEGRTYFVWAKCHTTSAPATRLSVKSYGSDVTATVVSD